VTGTGPNGGDTGPDRESGVADDDTTPDDAPATPDKQDVPTAPEDPVKGPLRTAFANFLVWATTGAGFVTLVAVSGGAVAWVRISQAQLPAEETLKGFSRDDFVDIGRIPMGLFGVLGLLAVAIVIAMDPKRQSASEPGKDQPASELRRGLCVLVGLGIAVAILAARDIRLGGTIAALVIDGLATLLGILMLTGPGVKPSDGEEYRQWREFHYRVGNFVRTPDGQLRPRGLWAGVGVAAVVGGIYFFIFGGLDGQWWVAGSVVVASALAGICFGVARASGGDAWRYGAAVFLSVSLFGAYLGIAINLRDPKISPIALLRRSADGTVSGIVGLYVVHGTDRTWLGTVTQECSNGRFHLRSRSGRLKSIPRNEVVDEEIGAPVGFADINERARELYTELVRRQPDSRVWPATPDNNAVTGEGCACATPHLEKVVPDHAGRGQSVELRGRAFGNRGTVTLRGKAMALGEWSPGLITAAVTDGTTSGPVVVRNACGRRSNAVTLTIAANTAPVANLSVSFARESRTFRLDSSGSFDPDGARVRHRIWRVDGRELRAFRDRRVARLTLAGSLRHITVELLVVDASGQASAPARQRLSTRVEVYRVAGDQTFAFDRDTLTPAGIRRLRQLRDRMARLRDWIVRVRVYGHTDYVGSAAYNLSLSQRRADRVREVVFGGLGVAARNIRPVKGLGERDARAHRSDDPRRAHDRRVDIFVRLERQRSSAK
jgi:outer membrane protein OmpA-like peptidoglycan-associated protein